MLASYGHIRDLPKGAMGVSLSAGRFAIDYELSERGREVASRLRAEAARAEAVVLATDLDREGEAIAWHLAEVLGQRTYLRATFNAITRDAVRQAINNPRALDLNLVNAQQARRVLDRVVGFAVSPTCKRGVGSKDARSAGRVQSVAVRLVAERELVIRGFKPTTYVVPTAKLRVEGKPRRIHRLAGGVEGRGLGHAPGRCRDRRAGVRLVPAAALGDRARRAARGGGAAAAAVHHLHPPAGRLGHAQARPRAP